MSKGEHFNDFSYSRNSAIIFEDRTTFIHKNEENKVNSKVQIIEKR